MENTKRLDGFVDNSIDFLETFGFLSGTCQPRIADVDTCIVGSAIQVPLEYSLIMGGQLSFTCGGWRCATDLTVAHIHLSKC